MPRLTLPSFRNSGPSPISDLLSPRSNQPSSTPRLITSHVSSPLTSPHLETLPSPKQRRDSSDATTLSAEPSPPIFGRLRAMTSKKPKAIDNDEKREIAANSSILKERQRLKQEYLWKNDVRGAIKEKKEERVKSKLKIMNEGEIEEGKPHFESDNEKNENENEKGSKFEMLKKVHLIVTNIEELPFDIQSQIEQMAIDHEILMANFEILLTVISFADKLKRKYDLCFVFFFSFFFFFFFFFFFAYFKNSYFRFFTLPLKQRYIQMKEKYSRPNLPNRILLDPTIAFEKMSSLEAKNAYRFIKYLGFGGFGEVLEVKCKLKNHLHYDRMLAIKIQPNTGDTRNDCWEEQSVVRYCNHPNIAQFYHMYEVRDELWLVGELVDGGTLKSLSYMPELQLKENEIAYIAREMLVGIHYLHTNHILHRDLKSSNVMLSLQGDVKLIDFGLAVDVSDGPRFGMVGSPFWVAPEMIRGDAYTYSVDIWSFIVCMCELANQRPPNSENVRRAMFLTATVGLENALNRIDDWSLDFQVLFFSKVIFFFFFFFFE
jgi:hypothetical protein